MAEQKAKVTVVCRVCGTASQAEFVIDEIDQPRHNLAVANVLAGNCTCKDSGACKWCKVYNADDGELAGIINERLTRERVEQKVIEFRDYGNMLRAAGKHLAADKFSNDLGDLLRAVVKECCKIAAPLSEDAIRRAFAWLGEK